MIGKLFIYIIVSVLVIWSIDSVNINAIFKKNRVMQSTMFYFLLTLSMIYLVTNFLMDIFTSIKMLF